MHPSMGDDRMPEPQCVNHIEKVDTQPIKVS